MGLCHDGPLAWPKFIEEIIASVRRRSKHQESSSSPLDLPQAGTGEAPYDFSQKARLELLRAGVTRVR